MQNKIYYGDNLDILRNYIESESVDLCYIDPPFNSKRNYNQIYNNVGDDDRASEQAFTDTWTWDDKAIEGLAEIQNPNNSCLTTRCIDLINGLVPVLGKGSLLAYLVSMTLRIAEIHRVLKPTGSFYLHCDKTACHYLKLVLDTLFCTRGGQFRNQIIWHYTGRRMESRLAFNSKHDVILFYAKSKKNIILKYPKEPYTREQYIKMKKQEVHTDEDGREWIWGHAGKGKSHHYRIYIDESVENGRAVDDVWDIPIINSSAKEKLGYDTQKPEKLLERIIKASSNEGDIVLDAYCGCGTTVAVAQKLNRHWIGIDITYRSISLILKRLQDNFGYDFTQNVMDKETQQPISAKVEINGVPKDMESAIALANKDDDRTRKEFEKWLILSYTNNYGVVNEIKGGDRGIDGIAYIPDRNEQGKEVNKKALFSVKSSKTLTPSVIRDLNGTIERDNAACGFLLTLYPMPNLVKECKQYGVYHNNLVNKDYPKIQVICVEQLLNGARLELPNVVAVVKKAQQHQQQLALE